MITRYSSLPTSATLVQSVDDFDQQLNVKRLDRPPVGYGQNTRGVGICDLVMRSASGWGPEAKTMCSAQTLDVLNRPVTMRVAPHPLKELVGAGHTYSVTLAVTLSDSYRARRSEERRVGK